MFRQDVTAWARGIVGCVIGLLAIGCKTPPQDESAMPGDGVSAVQFPDVPVPDGMQLSERRHRSDSLTMGDYRYANFVYTGSVPIPDVGDYLRERMPQHSWTLTADNSQEDGSQTLSFRRGKYTADCHVNRAKGESRTTLTVEVRTSLDVKG